MHVMQCWALLKAYLCTNAQRSHFQKVPSPLTPQRGAGPRKGEQDANSSVTNPISHSTWVFPRPPTPAQTSYPHVCCVGDDHTTREHGLHFIPQLLPISWSATKGNCKVEGQQGSQLFKETFPIAKADQCNYKMTSLDLPIGFWGPAHFTLLSA